MIYNSEALILSSRPYSDTSLICNLFTKTSGRLSIISKGARTFKNPNRAILQPLQFIDLHYYYRPKRNIQLLKEASINTHFFNPENLDKIRGISYKKNNKWIKTDFTTWEKELDDLVLPDRAEIKNSLYVRPDTGEPQATVITSRGCPSKCVFCLTPTISGTKLRLRSPENIHKEILECYNKHNIKLLYKFIFNADILFYKYKCY